MEITEPGLRAHDCGKPPDVPDGQSMTMAAGPAIAARVSLLLDRVVAEAHRQLRPALHPYRALLYLGLLMGLLLVLWLTSRFDDLELAVVMLGALYLAYEVLYLPVKRHVFGISVRSYLQDLVLFLLPAAIAMAAVTGTDLLGFLDVLGLFFALVVGFTRIGCFLGGCCYGMPSALGVRYPDRVFAPFEGGTCRRFTPPSDPGGRVFPIQLVDSAANFALAAGLFALLLSMGEPSGLSLPLYLLAYSAFRLGADFFRTSSSRPRYGPFSEAQLVAALVIVVCGGWVGVMLT